MGLKDRAFGSIMIVIGIIICVGAAIAVYIGVGDVDYLSPYFLGVVLLGLICILIGLGYVARYRKQKKLYKLHQEKKNLSSYENLIYSLAFYLEDTSDINGKLSDFQTYLRHRGFDYPKKSIKKHVLLMKRKIDFRREKPRLLARLFTHKSSPRPFMDGSAFCPDCGIFKNYEKECPHCGFHEMTI